MVRQAVAREAVLGRLRTKVAGKPLRQRVETYAFTPDGKVLAGKYPDGSVGVYGGGVDGDSPESAAKKEYREEGGRTLKNVEKLPVKPHTQLWKDDPTVRESESAKHKARREKFSGSKTIFMTGEVGGEAKVVDGSKLKDVKQRSIEELIDIQKKSLKTGDKEMHDVKKARLAVLERLREKTAGVIEDIRQQEAEGRLYAPEIYGHEAGHHAYKQRMGRLGTALDVGSTVAGLTGGGLELGGLTTGNPLMSTIGSGLGVLSDVPRLAEETGASRHSLRELRSQLTDEEYQKARKKLTAAGATYYTPTVVKGLTTGVQAAGLGLSGKHPELGKALVLGGQIGGLASPAISYMGQHIATKRMTDPAGKRMTADEIEQLHQQMAPDIALNVSDKPWEGGAFYMKKPKTRVGRWLSDLAIGDELMTPEKKKEFMERGGIHMAKTWTPQDLIRIDMEGAKPEKIEKKIQKLEDRMRKKEEKRLAREQAQAAS